MANIETKQIITIDTRKAAASLRELQAEINAVRAALAQMQQEGKQNSAAYQQQTIRLKSAQTEYNRVMRLSVKELQAVEKEQQAASRTAAQVVQSNKAVGNSYNALSVQLAKLKEEWKATGDVAKRNELGKEINKVKAQLSDLDHSIGNWQRNVGNYWQSIRNGIAKIAVALAACKGAWDVFKNAMAETQSTGDALKFTLGAIKDSYDALMTSVVSGDWSAFSGGFWAVYDAAVAARQAIDQLSNSQMAFDALTTQNTTKFNKYYNIWRDKSSTEEQKKDAYQQMREIIDAQYAYAEGYNKTALDAYVKQVVKEAGEANLDAARVTTAQFWKAMQIDVSGDPGGQRKAIENQYRDYQRKLAEFQGNNIAGQEKLKKQYADVIAIHAMLELMKDDELKGLSDILRSMESATQSAQSMERRLLRYSGGSTTTSGSKPAANPVEEARAQAMDTLTAQIIADTEAEAAALVKATEREIKAEQDHIASKEKEAAAIRAAANANALGAVSEREQGAIVTARATIDDEATLAAALYEIRKKSNEDRLALLRRFAQEAKDAGNLDEYLAYNKQAADMEVKIAQDAETEKARIRRKGVKDAEKQAKREREMMNATAAVMGNVASAYQAYIQQRVEGGKISEEQAEQEFKSVKAIQYAQTMINTLAGMMSVWAGEGTNAMKVVLSASVLTQGLAAAMQISNTTLGSTAQASQAVTSAAVAAPVIINAMPQVQAVTSASQEAVLNERAADQRVYVVYSDIERAGRKTRVTEGESRF